MSQFLRNYQYLVGDDPNRQYNQDSLKEYIEGEVGTAVTGLINMAPGQLDTLGEIADAIQNNPDFLTTLQGRDADLLAAIGISAGSQNIGVMATSELTNNSSAKQLFEEVGEAARRLRLGLGVPQGSSDMGTFSGSVIADASSVATALQALETFAEAEAARVDALIASDMWLFADQASFPPAASNHGRVVHSHADGAEFYAHAGQWIQLANHTSMESADTALSSRLDFLEADPVTKTYVDAEVAAVIDAAPGALDTLNELAASLGDDSNFIATITNQLATVQADVDGNETDGDAADAALSGRLDTLEADATTATAVAAVQADVDQNEADADAAIAAENAAMLAAVAVVQADVDQNETDADTAIAAENAAMLAAVAVVQADVVQNESDADAAIAAVQADVDANEVDRRAVVDIQSNITSVKNAVRGTSIEVGNNIALHPAAGGRVEVEGDLLLDNQTDVIDGAGVTLTSFTNINAYDGRLNTLEADPTTATALAAGDAATLVSANAYTDAEIASLIDASPGALDTLNELAAAMGDDANFATTVSNQIAVVQADVDQNETDADAAVAAENAAMLAAVAVVQADVDQNEADADAAVAAENAAMLAAVAVVQADVDQNETDADAAVAAVAADLATEENARLSGDTSEASARQSADNALGVRIDSVESEIDTARTNIYTALGTAAEGATAMGTFSGSILSDNTTVRALLQELETDSESRLSKLGGTLTGDLTLRKSDGSAVALEMSRADHADMNVVWKVTPSYVSSSKEVLSVLANGQVVAHFDERQRFAINMTDPDYTLDVGGDGHFSTDLTVGGTLTIGSTAITATGVELNYTDGVTSNIQTQLDAKLAAETITLTSFKAVVAASSDFADFQSRVAAL